ncbi:GNAT family N-acetyltransferase [Haloarchaeobius amylolyticus]|uniref:GNAT family N-acetyltransferase n=1 Tax=Haloarchaeobius amylolyticus TaxID=1198296 RepID=UPI00226F475A|nr:GNAT family N-acetyltransferase [Haloarchaeobius amylolyticus]
MPIRELTTEAERREAVPILRQLWADERPKDVLDWTGADDYHLFGQYADEELVGVAGVLVRQVLHHDRHAWLYDLVVDEAHRGAGHGRALVRFVEDWAREQDCAHVALASPLAKEGVHEYYEEMDYERWGYVIEKSL